MKVLWNYFLHNTIYLQRMDKLFNILNSRSVLARGSKTPINSNNLASTRYFLVDTRKFLLDLKMVDGTALFTTRR